MEKPLKSIDPAVVAGSWNTDLLDWAMWWLKFWKVLLMECTGTDFTEPWTFPCHSGCSGVIIDGSSPSVAIWPLTLLQLDTFEEEDFERFSCICSIWYYYHMMNLHETYSANGWIKNIFEFSSFWIMYNMVLLLMLSKIQQDKRFYWHRASSAILLWGFLTLLNLGNLGEGALAALGYRKVHIISWKLLARTLWYPLIPSELWASTCC